MEISDYKEFKKFIESLDYKPKLLLHVCCAPCSSHCLEVLYSHFDITIYFSNDNMMNEVEYEKRKNEMLRYIKERSYNIDVIDESFNPSDYFEAIKGYESLGEKSLRCYKCYNLRLRKSAIYAKNNNFDFFTTTLSVSPHKIAKWINEIGYNLEHEFDMPYLYSDFKKEEGFKESASLAKEYNLYCQCFCGCIYSYEEKQKKLEEMKKAIMQN